MKLNELYTPEELAEIKDAVYRISDAGFIFRDIAVKMAREERWRGQADMAHIAEVIHEQLTGPEGILHGFLSQL